MIIHLGAKIRELRKEKLISQEVLAQYLGVSFQAVSKWETDAAMPDVTLIPAIASFFGVSTDELFDYNRLEAEQKVDEICQEAAQCRDRNPAQAEAILRQGLRQFPGNDIILNNLLYTLRAPERCDEVVTICKTLIACTHDDAVKYDALRILAETYHQMGEQALVEPTLEQIPEIYFTKLEQMAHLLEGEKSLDAAGRQMALSSYQTVDMLLVMHDRLLETGNGDAAARYQRIAREILRIFHREEEETSAHKALYSRLCESEEPLP